MILEHLSQLLCESLAVLVCDYCSPNWRRAPTSTSAIVLAKSRRWQEEVDQRRGALTQFVNERVGRGRKRRFFRGTSEVCWIRPDLVLEARLLEEKDNPNIKLSSRNKTAVLALLIHGECFLRKVK
jgi:hypothetical protein